MNHADERAEAARLDRVLSDFCNDLNGIVADFRGGVPGGPTVVNTLAVALAAAGDGTDGGSPSHLRRPTILDTADIGECYHTGCETRLVARLDGQDEDTPWCPTCRRVVELGEMVKLDEIDNSQPRNSLGSTRQALLRNPARGVTP